MDYWRAATFNETPGIPLFVLPDLLVAFSGSFIIAICGDIRRAPGFSQTKYSGLVYYFLE